VAVKRGWALLEVPFALSARETIVFNVILSPLRNDASGHSSRLRAAVTKRATSVLWVNTEGTLPPPGMAALEFAMSMIKEMSGKFDGA
jgi:hypothetical protein